MCSSVSGAGSIILLSSLHSVCRSWQVGCEDRWQHQPMYPQVTPYLTGHTTQSGCSTQAADSPGNRDKIPSFFSFLSLSPPIPVLPNSLFLLINTPNSLFLLINTQPQLEPSPRLPLAWLWLKSIWLHLCSVYFLLHVPILCELRKLSKNVLLYHKGTKWNCIA